MGARYYYSWKVIQNYLDCALHTDMADIDAYYMTPTGKLQKRCLYVCVCVCLLLAANAPPPALFFPKVWVYNFGTAGKAEQATKSWESRGSSWNM